MAAEVEGHRRFGRDAVLIVGAARVHLFGAALGKVVGADTEGHQVAHERGGSLHRHVIALLLPRADIGVGDDEREVVLQVERHGVEAGVLRRDVAVVEGAPHLSASERGCAGGEDVQGIGIAFGLQAEIAASEAVAERKVVIDGQRIDGHAGRVGGIEPGGLGFDQFDPGGIVGATALCRGAERDAQGHH